MRDVPARVAGWELRFSLPGLPYVEPAFAALEPAPCGVCAHGVCLELDLNGWYTLLVSEGVLSPTDVAELRGKGATLPEVLRRAEHCQTRGYKLARVAVEPYAGGPVPSFAYALALSHGPGVADRVAGTFAGTADAALWQPPSTRYWRLIRNGAKRHGLVREYRDFIASLPRFAPSPFVIGVLPALAAAGLLAAARRQLDFSKEAMPSSEQSGWPQLPGPVHVGRGQIIVGPDPVPGVWDSFSSTPRWEVLQGLRDLAAKTGTAVDFR